MGTTAELAQFIVGTRYEQLLGVAVAFARMGILDCLGAGLAGSTQPVGKKMADFVRGIGGKSQAAVLGSGFRTSAPNAALVNGTMCHALDYDDGASGWHPSAMLLPTILALGEKASGRDLIEAYVVGFDVGARLGTSPGVRGVGIPVLHENGWHPSSVAGTVGAAAAAARLLKLDFPATVNALGIAASEAGGLSQNFGTMTKPFHLGNAARGGVTAALLAKNGFTASPQSIEGPVGYARAFSSGEKYNLAQVTADLGDPFWLGTHRTRNLNIKKYPTCAATHRILDGILSLREKYHLKPDDVKEIACMGPPFWDMLIYPEPKSGLEAKFSMQFCVAVALLEGKVGLNQVTDEKTADPAVKALLKKVKVGTYPDWVKGTDRLDRPDRVTVTLNNGTQHTCEVLRPKGDSTLPLSRDELAAKYRECAGMALSAKAAERSLELLEHLEEQPDTRELMGLVGGGK